HRAWHDDVGEQQIEGVAAVDDRQGLDGAGHRDGLIAEALDLGCNRFAHELVVLDHKNGLGAALDQWRRGSRLDGLLQSGGARQVELDGRTMSLLAVDTDVSSRLLDETIDHAQPEASALADALSREERVENLVADSRRNAGS